MKMSKDDINLLVDSLNESELSSIEYLDENFSIKIGRQNTIDGLLLNNEKNIKHSDSQKQNKMENPTSNYKKIISPIVGNFYSTKKPGDPDFVKIGDSIKKGQVIAIIEAMKVMNEVVSPYSGIIKKINISSGTFVDTNTVIIEID